MRLTFASLCTGGGLADVGAKLAGFEPIWGVEIDPEISNVAQRNLGHPVYAQSVCDTDYSALESPTVLWASPPCQGFSVAKNGREESDLDREIANAVIRAIETLQPPVFILENVALYRLSDSFKRIEQSLWDQGYAVVSKILNSADMGVPQSRRRFIVRALKKGVVKAIPKKERVGWYAAIEDLIPSLPVSSFAEWQLKQLPEELRETVLIDSSNVIRRATVKTVCEPSITILATIMRRPITTPKIFLAYGGTSDRGKGVRIRIGSDPSFAIEASCWKRPFRFFDGQVRVLNERAIARLQTVPDWYWLPTDEGRSPSRIQLTSKIIGNGVPCEMAKEIILSCREGWRS